MHRQVLDPELARRQQRQDAQARRLGRRLQRADKLVACAGCPATLMLASISVQHIKISLCVKRRKRATLWVLFGTPINPKVSTRVYLR